MREESVKILIEAVKDLDASREFAIDKLKEKYSLTLEQAEEKISKYW